MTRRAWSIARRYGVAVAAVGVALAVNLSLGLKDHFTSPLFIAAVAISAWWGGLGPGLLATAASALLLDYFFFPEFRQINFHPETWLWLGIYVAVAIFLNLLQEAQRRFAAELRRQDQRKREFMSVLAHELRNFLSPISGAVQILQSHEAKDDTIEQMCGIMQSQIGSMVTLIEELLDAARISQGKIRLSRESIDLGDAVRQAMQAVQPMIDDRAQRLKLLCPDAPLPIEGDRTRLQQILLNLLSNAAKYTPRGGEIQIATDRQAAEYVVRVRDNGQGISPSMLPHVFDLFAQCQLDSRGGLGIGLCLVRGLVELHGGSVTAFSDGPGTGSEFVVHLPVGSQPLVEPAAQASRVAALTS